MAEVTGKIEKISSREVNGRGGIKLAYTVYINGNMYGTFDEPPVKEGDSVTVTYTSKGSYNNIVKDGIKLNTTATVTDSTAVQFSDRQESIVRQSALKMTQDLFIAAGAVKSVADIPAVMNDIIEASYKYKLYAECNDDELALLQLNEETVQPEVKSNKGGKK